MDHPIDGVAERVQDARPSADSARATAGSAAAGLRQAAGTLPTRIAGAESANRARGLVHMQPLTAVLGAGLLGLGVGWLIGRRR